MPPQLGPGHPEIRSKVYSALMDDATCEACAALDGRHFALYDDRVNAPNLHCAGGEHVCRCVFMYDLHLTR